MDYAAAEDYEALALGDDHHAVTMPNKQQKRRKAKLAAKKAADEEARMEEEARWERQMDREERPHNLIMREYYRRLACHDSCDCVCPFNRCRFDADHFLALLDQD